MAPRVAVFGQTDGFVSGRRLSFVTAWALIRLRARGGDPDGESWCVGIAINQTESGA